MILKLDDSESRTTASVDLQPSSGEEVQLLLGDLGQGKSFGEGGGTQILTHFCPTFQHLLSERLTSLGIMGAPRTSLKPLRDDSALRALSSQRGLRGAPEVPPLCRETQSLGQQMLNATVGISGLNLETSYLC